jgi:hypothetical protein
MKAIAALLITLMMGVLIGQTHAGDRLSDVERQYNAGTLLADTSPVHAAVYAATKSRALALTLIRGTPERDLCTYKVTLDGKVYHGAILIHYDALNRVTRVQDFPRVYRDAADQAALGQGADVLSTAGALALGFSEGNPLFAPIVEHDPVLGMVVIGGYKAAMIYRADRSDYPECVQGRTVAAKAGYAFGAHNVVGVGAALLGLGNIAMPAGVLAGLLAWHASQKQATDDAILKCLM